jgi:hypothetical protein
MTANNISSSSRRPKEDFLLRAADRLTQALAEAESGRPGQWGPTLRAALAEVEATLRQGQRTAASPEGPLAEVDHTRPTLDRQAAAWRDDLAQLREQCRELLNEVQRQDGSGQPDLAAQGDLHRRVEEFIAALRRSRDSETDLVLESVNTDLGAGD